MQTSYALQDFANLRTMLKTRDVKAYKKASIVNALRFLIKEKIPLRDVLTGDSTTSRELLDSGRIDGCEFPQAVAFYATLLRQCASTIYFSANDVVPEIML